MSKDKDTKTDDNNDIFFAKTNSRKGISARQLTEELIEVLREHGNIKK